MKRICDPFAYGHGPVEHCYWNDTVDAPPRVPLEDDISADVAIVGAGFTGLNAALRLARAGRDVVVLDAQNAAWGASGRNGGFCCLGGAKADDAALTRVHGRDAVLDYRLAERDAVDFVDALITDEGFNVDRHSEGETFLAHRPKDISQLHDMAAWAKATHGVDSEFVPESDLAGQGLDGPFYAALTTPIGFALNPRKYALQLFKHASSAGARVFSDSAVTRIAEDGDGHRLSVGDRSMRAKTVIIATNGYSSEDVPDWMRARYLPVQSSILVTRQMTPAEIAAQGWSSHQMCYDTRSLLHYFRLMPNGRFLFGMRGGLQTDGKTHGAIRATIRRDFDRMFPAWSDVETPHYWSGFVCMTRDFRPFAGPVPQMNNMFAAFGYHGNGVAMGSYAGALVADRVLGKSDLRHPEIMSKPLGKWPGGPFRRAVLAPAYLGYRLSDS